ncbi:ABC-2 type transport system ATP-binding protein [Enterococcus sp. AZ194]|uniref:ATP-binding cassette domain-containing protein n=1 Tax=Enterococcus sp. AZ194 TaxID=2774629 RepID=UPI003F22A7C7
MHFIEVKNVTKKIKNQTILNDVSLSINRGEIATLEGINGSGKTVLLKAILGLIKVEGTIFVDEKEVLLSETYPIKAGVLIENPSIITNLSAFKNLELLALLQEGIEPVDIIELLKRVDLANVKDKKVKSFSLGMKQKLGIAQAMLGAHPLIILDEPTNALDKESLANLIVFVQQLNKKGVTFIIASHDSLFIEELSTHKFYMREGILSEE